MKQIGAGDNTLVRVTTTTLPLARDVKLEPQEVAFLDISNPGVVYVENQMKKKQKKKKDFWKKRKYSIEEKKGLV